MDESLRISGAVLTGGASRRMGWDKALIDLDGRVLAVGVADALVAAGAAPVVCVGGDLDVLAAHGLTAVADDHPGEGPLGGILTALRSPGSAEVVVVLATDLLRPDARAIRRVVSAVADGPARPDVAVPVVGGRRQWLHAAWRRDAALSALDAAFHAGERAIHRAAEGLSIREVIDVPPSIADDADRPEDLPPVATSPAGPRGGAPSNYPGDVGHD